MQNMCVRLLQLFLIHLDLSLLWFRLGFLTLISWWCEESSRKTHLHPSSRSPLLPLRHNNKRYVTWLLFLLRDMATQGMWCDSSSSAISSIRWPPLPHKKLCHFTILINLNILIWNFKNTRSYLLKGNNLVLSFRGITKWDSNMNDHAQLISPNNKSKPWRQRRDLLSKLAATVKSSYKCWISP